MGMYTELIFGAELKRNTPKDVVDTLRCMVGDIGEIEEVIFVYNRNPLRMSSESFAVDRALSKMWYSEISESWRISTRASIKNYDSDIEKFLTWISPYIESGSGIREMYAVVTYEQEEEPTLYYLHEG